MPARKTIQNLPDNSRFYVLVFSVLLSIFVLCLLRVQISGDQLFSIRAGQAFGYISAVHLYLALVVSPLKKVVGGGRRWVQNLEFSRRAIGVSAAYFAFLHAAVALWGQIGGFGGLTLLPERFVWSLAFGVIALVVLAGYFTARQEELGKPVLSDLKEGKLTLPLILLLPRVRAEERRLVEMVLEDRSFDRVSSQQILDLVHVQGTLEEVREMAEGYAAQAKTQLELFPPGDARDALEFAPDFVLNRRS